MRRGVRLEVLSGAIKVDKGEPEVDREAGEERGGRVARGERRERPAGAGERLGTFGRLTNKFTKSYKH